MAMKGACMLLLCFLAACFSAGSTYMFFDEDYTTDIYDGSNSSDFTPRTSYPKVHTPRTWICLTTSGGKDKDASAYYIVNGCTILLCSICAGLNATGGSIDKKWCGESCTSSNGTSGGGGSGAKDVVLGTFGALLAIVLFGSNFIPVKKYNTGDGESKKLSILGCHLPNDYVLGS